MANNQFPNKLQTTMANRLAPLCCHPESRWNRDEGSASSSEKTRASSGNADTIPLSQPDPSPASGGLRMTLLPGLSQRNGVQHQAGSSLPMSVPRWVGGERSYGLCRWSPSGEGRGAASTNNQSSMIKQAPNANDQEPIPITRLWAAGLCPAASCLPEDVAGQSPATQQQRGCRDRLQGETPPPRTRIFIGVWPLVFV